MNSKAVFVAALLGGTLATGSALAGERGDSPIYVDKAQRAASGGLGYVRNAPGSLAYIGCASTLTYLVCYAQNESRQNASCFLSSPSAVAQNLVASVKGDSYLSFNWDQNGVCTDIVVYNDSTLQPK